MKGMSVRKKARIRLTTNATKSLLLGGQKQVIEETEANNYTKANYKKRILKT